MDETNQVLGNQTTGTVGEEPTRPKGDGGVASTQATAPETQKDADVQTLKEQMEELAQKYEKDLRAMKSSLQRRESELTNDWQEMERQYQDKIRQLELAGLDDDARAEYEANFAVERMQELERRLNMTEQELQKRDAFNSALSYFTQAGISPSSLDVENGYEALIQSGWEALRTERDELRAKLSENKSSKTSDNQPKPPKPAPQVDVGAGAPGGGPTWADLRAKYGTDEEIYRAVEQGQLSPSVLPVPEVAKS